MPKIRLYTEKKLDQNIILNLPKEHTHYLFNVMRQKTGSQILFFNSIDGEWLGQINSINKKEAIISILKQTRKQQNSSDIWLCFAPVKNAPINNLVQKVTEMGVTKLQPVITERTVVTKVNTKRLLSIAIEAAEQSHRLTIPSIEEAIKLPKLLDMWDDNRGIILCDESGKGNMFTSSLQNSNKQKYAILIGPEGGFSKSEFEKMSHKSYITPVSMGPRILRADTAAIAALACYQNLLGDWDEQPYFEQQH